MTCRPTAADKNMRCSANQLSWWQKVMFQFPPESFDECPSHLDSLNVGRKRQFLAREDH